MPSPFPKKVTLSTPIYLIVILDKSYHDHGSICSGLAYMNPDLLQVGYNESGICHDTMSITARIWPHYDQTYFAIPTWWICPWDVMDYFCSAGSQRFWPMEHIFSKKIRWTNMPHWYMSGLDIGLTYESKMSNSAWSIKRMYSLHVKYCAFLQRLCGEIDMTYTLQAICRKPPLHRGFFLTAFSDLRPYPTKSVIILRDHTNRAPHLLIWASWHQCWDDSSQTFDWTRNLGN